MFPTSHFFDMLQWWCWCRAARGRGRMPLRHKKRTKTTGRQGDKRWMGARPTYRWRGGTRVRERLSVSQSSSSCTTDHIGVQKSVARSYRHVCCLCFVLCKLHTYEVASWNEYTRGLTVCRYLLWTYTSVCREERITETKYSLWRRIAIWGKKQTYEWLHTVPVSFGLAGNLFLGTG